MQKQFFFLSLPHAKLCFALFSLFCLDSDTSIAIHFDYVFCTWLFFSFSLTLFHLCSCFSMEFILFCSTSSRNYSRQKKKERKKMLAFSKTVLRRKKHVFLFAHRARTHTF